METACTVARRQGKWEITKKNNFSILTQVEESANKWCIRKKEDVPVTLLSFLVVQYDPRHILSQGKDKTPHSNHLERWYIQ